MTEFKDTERTVFQRMESTDQIMALYDMLRYVRGEIAQTKRLIINLQEDIHNYRTQREAGEIDTTAKIERVLSKRFDFWVYFRDKIVPPILTMIVIALLYLAFKTP